MAAYIPLVDLAKQFISEVLRQGDIGLDATVGNGHDTLFLAQQVGSLGRVYGFDVQAAAISRTKERVFDAGLQDTVTLFQTGHENLAVVLKSKKVPHVMGAMFNLGYLPSSDKSIQTLPETTLFALQGCLDVLKPEGRMTIIAYPGHAGGEVEEKIVKHWCEELPSSTYQFQAVIPKKSSRLPPELWLIEKSE